MSYGIYLARYDADGQGEADREAVRSALARWGWDGRDGSPYQVGTADGVLVECYASGLDHLGQRFDAVTLEVRGFSIGLCQLVLDVARAGPFAISHDDDPCAIILVDEEQRASLPADLADIPEVMICRTPEELETALEGGFDAWRAYRDRVCGATPVDGPAEPAAAPDRRGV